MGQGACCSHSSGPGPHALLLNFLVVFLLLVLLLLIPSWPIKPQGLVFSSAFCLVWLASHILLEPEHLLCSVIFLVIFLPFSFQAGTETNAGDSMYNRPYSLVSLLAGCKVLMLKRSLCFCLYFSPLFGSSWTTCISHWQNMFKMQIPGFREASFNKHYR